MSETTSVSYETTADPTYVSPVRAYRSANNVTQRELAGYLGVSQATVSLVERGEGTFNTEVAAKFEALLGRGSR